MSAPDLCPMCHVPLADGGPIGPFCATKDCPVVDDSALWKDGVRKPDPKVVSAEVAAPENPAAFPSVCLDDPCHPESRSGMSLLDYFAGQALAGMCADSGMNCGWSDFARASYAAAEAMLAERATRAALEPVADEPAPPWAPVPPSYPPDHTGEPGCTCFECIPF